MHKLLDRFAASVGSAEDAKLILISIAFAVIVFSVYQVVERKQRTVRRFFLITYLAGVYLAMIAGAYYKYGGLSKEDWGVLAFMTIAVGFLYTTVKPVRA